MGGDAMVIGANVAKREEIDAMIAAVVKHYGQIDVLVNNAGITRDTLMMRMKPDMWEDVIDTNLSSVFYASQVGAAMWQPRVVHHHAGPQMMQQSHI